MTDALQLRLADLTPEQVMEVAKISPDFAKAMFIFFPSVFQKPSAPVVSYKAGTIFRSSTGDYAMLAIIGRGYQFNFIDLRDGTFWFSEPWTMKPNETTLKGPFTMPLAKWDKVVKLDRYHWRAAPGLLRYTEQDEVGD